MCVCVCACACVCSCDCEDRRGIRTGCFWVVTGLIWHLRNVCILLSWKGLVFLPLYLIFFSNAAATRSPSPRGWLIAKDWETFWRWVKLFALAGWELLCFFGEQDWTWCFWSSWEHAHTHTPSKADQHIPRRHFKWESDWNSFAF